MIILFHKNIACHLVNQWLTRRVRVPSGPHKAFKKLKAFFLKLMIMQYFVYILKSDKSDVFYKGYTTDLSRRLFEHNNGLSRYTSDKGPWKLIYFKEFETKKEALIEELRLKKLNRRSIEKIILEFNHDNSLS